MDDSKQTDDDILNNLLRLETNVPHRSVTSLFGGVGNNTNIHIGNIHYKPTIFYGQSTDDTQSYISQRQVVQLRRLLVAAADWECRVCNHPKTYTQLCAELKEKFNFVHFDTLPEHQFEHAIAYLERIIGRLAASQ